MFTVTERDIHTDDEREIPDAGPFATQNDAEDWANLPESIDSYPGPINVYEDGRLIDTLL